MSNSKLDIKSKFFVYDKDEAMYKCTIGNCNSRFKGALNSLKRHIATIHPDVSKNIGLDKYKSNVSSGEPKPKKLKTVPVEVDPDEFVSGLVELASIQGVSLNLFDSSGFKKTGGVLAKALGLPSHTDAIVLLVKDVAGHVREIISEEMQGTLFCLKFDGACRHSRKIFGITAQYLLNGQITSRTLSIEDMTERQTGENLKERILGVLDRFNTSINNVYAATTDNGKNMIKCTENLRKEQELELMEDSRDDDEEDDDDDDEELKRKLAEQDVEVENLITAADEIITRNDGCIESIKCGAHTFNLIVKDALATVDDDWVKEVRKLVKTCKRMEHRALFEIAKIALPTLDVETRWSSTWDMIESVLNHEVMIKAFGDKCAALKLSDETWLQMKAFQCAFKHLYASIKALQSESIIMGDLLKIIKQCQFHVKKLSADNPFSVGLNDAIERRIKSLMENNAFRAAILFDQRWCFLDSPFFTKDDKLQAIEHALKVSNLLQTLKKTPTAEPEQGASNTDENDDFEAMLQQECNVASTSDSVSQVDLKVKLIHLANSKTRLPASTDILKHWEARRYDDPELYDLAMVCLSAAVTQVTVERCFSAVKLLLEDHRMNMSSSRLDDLMIIRCNRDLLPEAIRRYKQQKE